MRTSEERRLHREHIREVGREIAREHPELLEKDPIGFRMLRWYLCIGFLLFALGPLVIGMARGIH